MRIHLDSGSRGTFGKRVDLDTLPAVHTERQPRFAGVFVILFALFWGGGPTVALVIALVKDAFEPGLLVLLVFTVIGAGLFILGLWLLTRVVTTQIDAGHVTRESKWMFGHDLWREPLAAYPGVCQRSEHHSGGRNSPSYTLYIVELHHADRKCRVRLYESRVQDGIRGVWEDCCRKLDKPALEDENGTVRARPVEDLDKSVRDLAREGKIAVAFDPSVPPPVGLTLSVQGDTLRIVMGKEKTAVSGLLLMLAIPSVFIYIGFFVKGVPPLFGIAGALFLAVFLAAAGWGWVAEAALDVHRDGVKPYWMTPWGATPGVWMAADTVESVRIARPAAGNTRGEAVLITGDTGTLTVGQGLDRAAQEWLKNCILAVITK